MYIRFLKSAHVGIDEYFYACKKLSRTFISYVRAQVRREVINKVYALIIAYASAHSMCAADRIIYFYRIYLDKI